MYTEETRAEPGTAKPLRRFTQGGPRETDGMIRRRAREKAEQMLAEAKRIAPEDTGEYKQSLHIETVEHEHRKTYLVVSDDEDALLHESNFHTLTKALKKVRSG